jgi:hypothetical protein
MPPFYDEERINRTDIPRLPLQGKRDEILKFLNRLNDIVHPNDSILLTGRGETTTEALRIKAVTWLRKNHVSLFQRDVVTQKQRCF